MPLEIEVKLRIPSHDAIRAALQREGAARLGRVREHNIFFDRPSGELRQKDSGLRVRIAHPQAGPPTALLTFKGPPGQTGLRAREAFDLHIDPVDQLVPLLQALGFQQILLFEKNRETWQLDNCLIELDELPSLGHFVEIEAQGPDASETAVRAMQRRLGLDALPDHLQSYSRMARDAAGPSAELRF
ncbi:MAG TPA: class IV adenylate cyclase [Phycisphaerae bacterium]|nr:class IV adenylate cyclase [Phycisphaerae bacterium]